MSQSSLPKFASSLYNKLAIVTNLQLRHTHSQKRTNLLIKPKLCLYIIIQAYPKSQLFAPTISRLPRFSLPKRADIYYNKSMNIQKILSGMRRACSELKLIDDADKIAVGVSGGKDSLALLAALAAFRRFSPERFELHAVTIDLGLGADYSPVQKFCDSLNVPYKLEKTDIGDVIFNVRKEKNPCSLCSKMRRGALAGAMKALGCNKLALGHHADDLAETFLLSLFYEGRLSTFSPKAYMSRSGITVIRPFVYITEADVTALARDENLPVVHNPCPANHNTQREYVKNLIKNIMRDIPIAKERMISALTHPERNNLWN